MAQSVSDECFNTQERWIDRVAVLAVQNDLDMLTAPMLTEAIGAVASKRPTVLIIDLTDVDFLASAGMSALLNAQRDLGESLRLAVVAAGPTTARPLKVIGLDDLLRLYPSLDAALSELA